MALAMLDTTVLIDILCARPEARVADRGWRPYVCAIGVDEIARRLRSSELTKARRLFAGLRVTSLGEVEGWQAGAWRHDFAARGVTLSQADCVVAAAALSAGARVCTGNPKDLPMTEINVEHWPVGR